MRTAAFLLAVGALALALASGCSEPQTQPTAHHATARSAAARSKPFVASLQREPFHAPSCKRAKKISDRNLVGYDFAIQAVADGRRPCKVCNP